MRGKTKDKFNLSLSNMIQGKVEVLNLNFNYEFIYIYIA